MKSLTITLLVILLLFLCLGGAMVGTGVGSWPF